MAAATSPNIIANPQSDGTFVREAQRHANDGAETPQELEHRLRERYAKARVVTGITDGVTERWYAYREGYWTAD